MNYDTYAYQHSLMTTGEYRCPTCNKEYRQRRACERHTLICEIPLLKEDGEPIILGPEQTPSTYLLYQIIQQLLIRDKKKEKDICELNKKIVKIEKTSNSRKPKISIIEWLNNNRKPTQIYSRWYKDLQSQEQLKLMYEPTIICGMMMILEEIVPESDKDKIPICCFKDKSDTFYIYDDECEWVKITMEQFIQTFITTFKSQLQRQGINWYNNNVNCIMSDYEHISNKYLKIMHKVYSPKIKPKQLEKSIFKYLSVDMKEQCAQFVFEY